MTEQPFYEEQKPEEIEVPQEVEIEIEIEAPEQEQKAKVTHETKQMKVEDNK